MEDYLRPYAGRLGSAPLADVPRAELEEYIRDSIPGAGVDSLWEPDRLSIIFRVGFGTKYFTIRMSQSTPLYDFEDQIDMMLERIQEELDREPEEPFVPKAWVPKEPEDARVQKKPSSLTVRGFYVDADGVPIKPRG